MKWAEQVEPERVEALAVLPERCGLATALELLVQSQRHQLCVWFESETKKSVHAYLASHAVEAGGLLLGSRFTDPAHQSIVSIERFVPGTDFDGTGVSLSLGTKLWDDARPWIEAGSVVVGWVHSHPNLGAFFSGTDRRTQRAFFSAPWQVGLCIDPVRKLEAWFYGSDSQSEGIFVI